jgi:hypothetical protein
LHSIAEKWPLPCEKLPFDVISILSVIFWERMHG